MSISLSTVLQVKPSTWSNESYTGTNCVTVEVSSYSDEYTEIESAIRSSGANFNSISRIERVQHPFAFARFLLRKEQLEKRNGYSLTVERKFNLVSTSQVKEALEYNMDDRRIPIYPISTYYTLPDCCAVVMKNCGNSRDSERYPEYVIYFC